MNQRFDAVEKGFARIDARFTSMDTRFTSMETNMNAQFDRLVNIMIAIVAAFAAVVASTIGFAVWDRHTMTRPFEAKVQTLEGLLGES